MKISITYLYTIFRYGYPPRFDDDLRALAEVRKMGFHYLEMEALGPRHLASISRNCLQFKEALQENGLHVHNFCVVDPDLVSLNEKRRYHAFDRFGIAAGLGDFLGAETLHLASYAPPVLYIGERPYQLGSKNGYSFVDTAQIRIPPGFDWSRVWDVLVSSCQYCAEIASQYGKTIIMEPRVGEVICSVDSMLRLIEHVNRPNFKANFDTAHFCAQRENVPLALMKLKGKFANIHLADNIPVNTQHLPVGKGIIDWREFFRVLKGMDYTGYLGLDLGATRSLVSGYRHSVEYLRKLAAELKFDLEL